MPSFDERHLFEMLNLEGAQAGLSWITILKKRENYRAAFDGFDPEKVARYDEAKVASLLADAGIVRNRLKVAATIGNAAPIWRCARAAGRSPTSSGRRSAASRGENRLASMGKVPAKSAESDRAVEDAGETRLQVRRLDDRLRLPAGGRLRQRPPRRLLPARRDRAPRA